MPMTLAEFYAKLEGFEGGSELVTFVKGKLAEANGEAKTNREAKESLTVQLNALTSERDGLQAKLSEIEKAGGQGQSEIEKLQKQMKAWEEKYQKAEEARLEAEQKRVQADISSQTIAALTKANAMDPQEFAKLITPNITVGEDGKYAFTKQDGTIGSIEDGVNEWLTGKAWAVKDNQLGGGNGEGGAPNGNNSIADAFRNALG